MTNENRYKDLLDYTVSYKAVWSIIGVAVAIGIAGWFAYQRFKPPGADEKARQVLKEGGRLARRADGCAQEGTPAELLEKLSAGRGRLEEARQHFEASRFQEALGRGEEARDRIREFNDAVCTSLEAVARFIDFRGNIKVKTSRSPRWVSASKGTRLLPGDRIRVDAGTATVQYKNGMKQTLSKGTLIQIQGWRPQADGPGTADIRFEHGEMVSEGAQDDGSTIHTDFGVARPRGGDIELKRDEGSREIEVRSRRGGSSFQAGDQRRDMTEVSRLSGRLGRGGEAELSPVEPDLLGPEPREPLDGRHFLSAEPGSEMTIFEWNPAAGANAYAFHLGRNEWFDPLLNAGSEAVPSGRVDSSTEAEVLGLPPGTYYWRVAAHDPAGRQGRWSATRRFTVSEGSPPDDRPPPALDVSGRISVGDKYIFSGTCDTYARLEVYVNDKRWADVSLEDDGGFTVMVPVEHEGSNTFTFVAQDTYGMKTEVRVPVYWSGD